MEIPKDKKSREHYAPKSHLPKRIAQLPNNIFPSIEIFNFIKGDRFPCEWEMQKYDLCYHALQTYRLSPSDKKLIKRALEGMPRVNPCEKCICRIYKEYCVNKRQEKVMKKAKQLESFWKQCWIEYKMWFCEEWKNAWYILREAVVSMISAAFQWVYTIIGALFGGFWKLVLKPVLHYINKLLVDLIKKL